MFQNKFSNKFMYKVCYAFSTTTIHDAFPSPIAGHISVHNKFSIRTYFEKAPLMLFNLD